MSKIKTLDEFKEYVRNKLANKLLLNHDYIDASNEEKVKMLLNFILMHTQVFTSYTIKSK